MSKTKHSKKRGWTLCAQWFGATVESSRRCAQRYANRIAERGRDGKIHWQQETNDNPIACQRLANGNTLIVTYKALYEVTREHKEIFRHTDRRDFRDARRSAVGIESWRSTAAARFAGSTAFANRCPSRACATVIH